MSGDILGERGYQYQVGDLVRERGCDSRYNVLDVRGEQILIATGLGACLVDAKYYEPLTIDPRRVIDE